MTRQLIVLVCTTLFIGACSQGSPTSPSSLAPRTSVSQDAATTTSGATVSSATMPGTFLPTDEPAAAPPTASGPVVGCGGCDPMNNSLTASLICETRWQIQVLEDQIRFLDQQIPVVKGAVAHKQAETEKAWLDLVLWDTMQAAYLAGNGPDPKKVMGDRAGLLAQWQMLVKNLKWLRELLAQHEAARQSAPKTIEALRQYLALLEKDLFEFCHDQPAVPGTPPAPPAKP